MCSGFDRVIKQVKKRPLHLNENLIEGSLISPSELRFSEYSSNQVFLRLGVLFRQ